jgi:large subunit ribosomal protein L25
MNPMELTQISAEQRQSQSLGKGPSRRSRLAGVLPAVVYGKGVATQNITVTEKDIEKVLRTKRGKNTLLNLSVDGAGTHKVLIKDYQGDPLSRRVRHVDFWAVDENQEITVDIDVKLTGKAPGLLEGGIVDQISHSIDVICKVSQIPDEILVDIGGLHVGKNIHLAEVKLPGGVRVKAGYNPTLVAMVVEKEEVAPVVAEVATAEGATATPAEGAAAAKPGDAKAAAPAAGGKDAKAATPAKGDAKAAAPAKGDAKPAKK